MIRQIGIIGLGKMGSGIAIRILRCGFDVWGYDMNSTSLQKLEIHGLHRALSVQELVEMLPRPRLVWIMLPSGTPTEDTVRFLSGILEGGDCIIEGGNSNYKDSMERSRYLAERDIFLVDMGISGGIWGEKEGYGMMFGAEEKAAKMIMPFVKSLAPSGEKGWVHTGPPGSGHYVKMIHNAIEYGIMQAYAEGLELMRKKDEFNLDLASVSEAWKYGTVIRSWILDLLAEKLVNDQELADIAPQVNDSGEGRWALHEAIDLEISVPVLSASLFERFSSRDEEQYAAKILSVIRNAFGGHPVKKVT